VIFVDSNVPMYLVGGAHPNKDRARQLLEESAAANESMCTDAEVLQEILHRYAAIGRYADIDPAFDVLTTFVDVIYPIEHADVDRARRIILGAPKFSARDALHIAVMQRQDVDRVLTFDSGFDGIPGLTRIS
jgi:uncharacterized protein